MAYTTEEGRRRLLGDLARGVQQLSIAVASLGEAYELLDEQAADRLESELFRPVQLAYGRAARTCTEFAARHGVAAPALSAGTSGTHSGDPRSYVQRALEAVGEAEAAVSELQDSMLPVEVGDRELRDGLAGVREQIASVPVRARELMRTIGR